MCLPCPFVLAFCGRVTALVHTHNLLCTAFECCDDIFFSWEWNSSMYSSMCRVTVAHAYENRQIQLFNGMENQWLLLLSDWTQIRRLLQYLITCNCETLDWLITFVFDLGTKHNYDRRPSSDRSCAQIYNSISCIELLLNYYLSFLYLRSHWLEYLKISLRISSVFLMCHIYKPVHVGCYIFPCFQYVTCDRVLPHDHVFSMGYEVIIE